MGIGQPFAVSAPQPPRTCVIFRPGAASSGIYVATYAEVQTVCDAVKGKVDIGLDPSAGGSMTWPDATVVKGDGSGKLFPVLQPDATAATLPVTLTITDGGQVKNFIVDGPVKIQGAPTVRSFLAYDSGMACQLLGGACIANTGGATKSPIDITVDTPLIMRAAKLQTSGSIGGVNVPTGKTMNVYAFDGSVVTGHIASGEGTVNYTSDSSSSTDPTTPSPIGPSITLTKVRAGLAAGLDPSQSTTAGRPSSPKTGQMHFDTTLGKPIWWSGSAWVLATGVGA